MHLPYGFAFHKTSANSIFLGCNLAHDLFPYRKGNHIFMFQVITEDAQLFSCEYTCNIQKENNLDGNYILCMTVVLLWSWAKIFFSHSSEGRVDRSSSSQVEQYYSCVLQSRRTLDPPSKISTVLSLIFLLSFYSQVNCINRHLKGRSVGLFLSLVNFLHKTHFIIQDVQPVQVQNIEVYTCVI